jgi:hypothetical protein
VGQQPREHPDRHRSDVLRGRLDPLPARHALTGGFSMTRVMLTRRRPIGSRQDPVLLFGILLILPGIIVDVTF